MPKGVAVARRTFSRSGAMRHLLGPLHLCHSQSSSGDECPVQVCGSDFTLDLSIDRIPPTCSVPPLACPGPQGVPVESGFALASHHQK